jgi:hypothetical protein
MSTNMMLLIALGLTAIAVWSVARRILKLAVYTAAAGALAWLWYFGPGG